MVLPDGVLVSETQLFFDAIRCGDIAAVRALLDQDSALLTEKNAQLQSPVLFSIYNRQKEIRDLLLSRSAFLELHEAAAAGDLAQVREFVEKDASLAKSLSPDGFPVLALAAVFGNFEVTKYLHAKGGEINAVATNGSGYNALTGAVASGHTEIAKWLLENGADANYRYANGYSPLLTAAANGHLEILKALLARGADLHAKTSDGKNALAFADERKHAEVAEYLRSKGLS
jgi:ankyrin repeat protein